MKVQSLTDEGSKPVRSVRSRPNSDPARSSINTELHLSLLFIKPRIFPNKSSNCFLQCNARKAYPPPSLFSGLCLHSNTKTRAKEPLGLVRTDNLPDPTEFPILKGEGYGSGYLCTPSASQDEKLSKSFISNKNGLWQMPQSVFTVRS